MLTFGTVAALLLTGVGQFFEQLWFVIFKYEYLLLFEDLEPAVP